MDEAAPFVQVFRRLIAIEGYESCHPADPGGHTVYGISRRHHPEMFRDGAPTEAQACAFYREQFWEAQGLDAVENDRIAWEMFEAAVNCGVTNAAKWVQEAFNILRPDDFGGCALKKDGVFGPKTLRAVNLFCRNRQWATAMVRMQNVQQARHYLALVQRRPEMRVFLRGWFANRLD